MTIGNDYIKFDDRFEIHNIIEDIEKLKDKSEDTENLYKLLDKILMNW